MRSLPPVPKDLKSGNNAKSDLPVCCPSFPEEGFRELQEETPAE